MARKPPRARLLWAILSLALPVTCGHTTARRSAALAHSAPWFYCFVPLICVFNCHHSLVSLDTERSKDILTSNSCMNSTLGNKAWNAQTPAGADYLVNRMVWFLALNKPLHEKKSTWGKSCNENHVCYVFQQKCYSTIEVCSHEDCLPMKGNRNRDVEGG